jgi:hypothetical protein
MSPALYDAVCDLAGDALALRLPRRFGIDARLPSTRVGVYIVLDAMSRVRYVGSVARADAGAASSRLREHGARLGWRWVLVIPLREDTTASRVRRIEGDIGRILRPPDNHRLPRSAA